MLREGQGLGEGGGGFVELTDPQETLGEVAQFEAKEHLVLALTDELDRLAGEIQRILEPPDLKQRGGEGARAVRGELRFAQLQGELAGFGDGGDGFVVELVRETMVAVVEERPEFRLAAGILLALHFPEFVRSQHRELGIATQPDVHLKRFEQSLAIGGRRIGGLELADHHAGGGFVVDLAQDLREGEKRTHRIEPVFPTEPERRARTLQSSLEVAPLDVALGTGVVHHRERFGIATGSGERGDGLFHLRGEVVLRRQERNEEERQANEEEPVDHGGRTISVPSSCGKTSAGARSLGEDLGEDAAFDLFHLHPEHRRHRGSDVGVADLVEHDSGLDARPGGDKGSAHEIVEG
jgi:hypothetical protein